MNDYPKTCAECGKYEIEYDEFAGLESAEAICLVRKHCIHDVQDSVLVDHDMEKWLAENRSERCPMLNMYSHKELI